MRKLLGTVLPLLIPAMIACGPQKTESKSQPYADRGFEYTELLPGAHELGEAMQNIGNKERLLKLKDKATYHEDGTWSIRFLTLFYDNRFLVRASFSKLVAHPKHWESVIDQNHILQ